MEDSGKIQQNLSVAQIPLFVDRMFSFWYVEDGHTSLNPENKLGMFPLSQGDCDRLPGLRPYRRSPAAPGRSERLALPLPEHLLDCQNENFPAQVALTFGWGIFPLYRPGEEEGEEAALERFVGQIRAHLFLDLFDRSSGGLPHLLVIRHPRLCIGKFCLAHPAVV